MSLGKHAICITCKLPACEECTHSNHKCVPKQQIANHILSEYVAPAEQFVLQKMQYALDAFTDVFYLIRKGVVQQFGLDVPIESLAQRTQQELPDLLKRIENLKTSATTLLEQIKAALKYPIESIIVNNKEQQIEAKIIEPPKPIEPQIKQIQEQRVETPFIKQNDRITEQQLTQSPPFEPDLTEYYLILQQLQQHKEKFRDEEFPPTDASLGASSRVVWKRVTQIHQNQIKFFPKNRGNVFGIGDSVTQSDIIAGVLGDELIYGLAYLFANHCPDILKECFLTQEICQEGIYALKLYDLKGVECIIYVDDFCPFDPMVQLHVALMGTDYSIWIMLLEKAIAKMIGSYQAAAHQNFQAVIHYLTPAHPIMLNTSHELIFDKIEEQLKQKALIIVYPLSNVDNQGLSPLNFYQVVDIITLNEDLQLVKLRNPWGEKQWMGNWSHSSPEWTRQLRSQMNLEQEGFFYMDIFSLIQQFSTLFCYRVYDKHQDSIMVSSQRNQGVYCKLTVSEEQECLISIFKESREINKKEIQKILVFQEGLDNTYTIVKPHMSYLGVFSTTFKAKKGTYVIYSKLLWENNDSQDARIAVFGRKPMKLVQVQKIQNLLSSGFNKVTEQKGELQSYELGSWKILDWRKYGWQAILIKNTTTSSQNYKLKFQQFKNAKLCKPFNEMNDNEVNFPLNPNKTELFIIKCDLRTVVDPILYTAKRQYY